MNVAEKTEIKHQPFEQIAGNDTLAVLIHGYVGSPDQFRNLSDQLHADNIDCAAFLLPGHGGDSYTLGRCREEDWQQHVCMSVDRLRAGYQHVFLVGHSLGALLSLEYAVDCPVDGVVSISAPMGIRLSLFSLILGIRMKFSNPAKDPAMVKAYREGCSIRMVGIFSVLSFIRPTIALLRTIRRVSNVLPQLRVPVLIIQSEIDETVSRKSADRINQLIKSSARILWLKQSRHAYLVSAEEALVTAQIRSMIKGSACKTDLNGKSLAR